MSNWRRWALLAFPVALVLAVVGPLVVPHRPADAAAGVVLPAEVGGYDRLTSSVASHPPGTSLLAYLEGSHDVGLDEQYLTLAVDGHTYRTFDSFIGPRDPHQFGRKFLWPVRSFATVTLLAAGGSGVTRGPFPFTGDFLIGWRTADSMVQFWPDDSLNEFFLTDGHVEPLARVDLPHQCELFTQRCQLYAISAATNLLPLLRVGPPRTEDRGPVAIQVRLAVAILAVFVVLVVATRVRTAIRDRRRRGVAFDRRRSRGTLTGVG